MLHFLNSETIWFCLISLSELSQWSDACSSEDRNVRYKKHMLCLVSVMKLLSKFFRTKLLSCRLTLKDSTLQYTSVETGTCARCSLHSCFEEFEGQYAG